MRSFAESTNHGDRDASVRCEGELSEPCSRKAGQYLKKDQKVDRLVIIERRLLDENLFRNIETRRQNMLKYRLGSVLLSDHHLFSGIGGFPCPGRPQCNSRLPLERMLK